MSIPNKMSETQLENHLELMIKEILKKIMDKNPSMKINITPEKIKALAQSTAKLMMQKGFEFSREDVIDKNPKFIINLTRALTLTAKLDNIDDLFNAIKKVFDENKINAKDLKSKSPEDLQKENKLTPAEALQLKRLLERLEEATNDLQKLNLMKPPAPTPGTPKPKVNPLVVELLGVMLEGQTGSIQPVVQQFNGNYLGIDNKNPNSSTGAAQIDQQQKIDSLFGDPQGMEHQTMERFEATGCTFKELIDTVHAEIMRPKLTINK